MCPSPESAVEALFFALTALVVQPATSIAQPQLGLDVEDDTLTRTVLIHSPVETPKDRSVVLFTREHTYRPQYRKGDQLARDFIVMRIGDDGIMRPFKPETGGERNEDWYTWRENVMAPFDGTVTLVQHPDSTNKPGRLNREAQHGEIHFEDEDGVIVSFVHVREIVVTEGQRVEAGEVVAKVGNNGSSIAPHLHVGAWKDSTPLQIQRRLYEENRFSKKEATEKQ